MKNRLLGIIIALTVLISMACLCNPLGMIPAIPVSKNEKSTWTPLKQSAEIRTDGIHTNHGNYLEWGHGVLVYACTANDARISPIYFKDGVFWAEWIPRYGLKVDVCSENAP